VCSLDDANCECDYYYPDSAHDLGWLGHYICNNTTLQELHLWSSAIKDFNTVIKPFYRQLSQNTTIQKISFVNLVGGETCQSLGPFFGNNNNLKEMVLENCELGAGGCQLLALTIGGCKGNSLKRFAIDNVGYDANYGGQLVEVVVALSMHSQLEKSWICQVTLWEVMSVSHWQLFFDLQLPSYIPLISLGTELAMQG